MEIVLTIIALQQGLFALGWWVAGSLLRLSRRAALHWGGAAFAAGLALALALLRGRAPEISEAATVALSYALAVGGFIAVRRGVQVFLQRRPSDGESAVLGVLALAALGIYVVDSRQRALAMVVTSALIAWTLLRCAFEAHRALRRQGDPIAARVVTAPLVLLGGLFAARVAWGLLDPGVPTQAPGSQGWVHGALVVSLMLVGLLLNMVLAYLVANRLVRRLQLRALTDPLTGLNNRRALEADLQREFTRLRRHGDRFAVLAVDVDHFKAVNDRHGHAAGDAVLARLGTLLREAARDIDSVARTGGEEFCVLLPRSELDGARHVAERLCTLVRGAGWAELAEPLTVSVGVALARREDSTPQAVLARADAALLRAKETGRDRVVVAAS